MSEKKLTHAQFWSEPLPPEQEKLLKEALASQTVKPLSSAPPTVKFLNPRTGSISDDPTKLLQQMLEGRPMPEGETAASLAREAENIRNNAHVTATRIIDHELRRQRRERRDK